MLQTFTNPVAGNRNEKVKFDQTMEFVSEECRGDVNNPAFRFDVGWDIPCPFIEKLNDQIELPSTEAKLDDRPTFEFDFNAKPISESLSEISVENAEAAARDN